MAFDLNFGGMSPQLPLMDSSYNPTQSSLFSGTPLASGSPVSPVANVANNSGMFGAFSDWLGGDTGRSLFGGTDPSTGFQSAGIVSPVLQGLGSLFQAWNGMQTMGLAKDQLNFQKNAFNTNLNNQRQVYNTALEDRIRGRTSNYDGKEQEVQNYLNQNRL